MAQPNFEEKLEIEKLHIESTDVMTGFHKERHNDINLLSLSVGRTTEGKN